MIFVISLARGAIKTTKHWEGPTLCGIPFQMVFAQDLAKGLGINEFLFVQIQHFVVSLFKWFSPRI